ncbi:ethanolamine-phosphate phospho-lyase-like [Amphibalanus amphitrite]|uniref:ethanolamine-phosphate phospho-lyase-like n=1 Tax=Amphibalanus amphitrite TaxID=1232801 RepID=UPI001C91B6A0|nr:ethanolamine-phosphate phospho-lyase-like [Amphibalanus amphitrite]
MIIYDGFRLRLTRITLCINRFTDVHSGTHEICINLLSIVCLYNLQYRPSPLACAIGTTVLRVLEQEDLMARARDVGALLKRHLLALKAKHSCVGDVRGEGLLLGVDIVTVSDRKPDRQACQCVVYRLKEEERIIAASEGEHLNVLYITPPLCFSEENARSLVAALDRVLTYMEENGTDINFSSLGASLLEPEAEPVDLATYEDVD